MKFRTYTAVCILLIATIGVLGSGWLLLTSHVAQATSSLGEPVTIEAAVPLQKEPKEIRYGKAVAAHAKVLRKRSKAAARAMEQLESRGYKPAFEKGVIKLFEKEVKQHHARRQDQDPLLEQEPEPIPPGTPEVTHLSYESVDYMWVGVAYETAADGTEQSSSIESIIADDLMLTVSRINYNAAGEMTGQYYNTDWYDLSEHGFYGQGDDYYASLQGSGNCGAGCGGGLNLIWPIQGPPKTPSPSPTPTPRPTPHPCPTCPPPRPMPLPGNCCPDTGMPPGWGRCVLTGCVPMAWGCAFTGPWFPVCGVGGCAITAIFCL